MSEAYVADVTKPELYPFSSKPPVRSDPVVRYSGASRPSEEVLRRHLRWTAPGGCVLISVPNIAIWSVRLELLFGRFEYQDTGTLDRTHIRYFTQRTFGRFARKAGLEIRRSRITPGILRPFVPWIKKIYGAAGALDHQIDSPSIMDSVLYQFYLKWLYPLERAICRIWPGLLAFQIVILTIPQAAGSGATYSDSSQPLEKQLV